MKFLKSLAVICLLLAAMVFVVPSANAAAPTIVLAGAGSTAVFNALYDAAQSGGGSSVCGTNLWSQGGGTYPGPFTAGGTMFDNRNGHGIVIPDDNSKIWIAFDGTSTSSYTDTTILCFYIAVDSSVGVRGFLAAPRALLRLGAAAGSAGGSQVNGFTDNVPLLPQAIYNDINEFGTVCAGTTMTTCTTVTGVPINAAFSDIRPEDAQFATFRMLAMRPYPGGGTTPTSPGYFASTNLGYGNWNTPFDAGATPVLSGTSVLSSFSTTAATPTYFEQVPGVHDAITGTAMGQYATWPVGAIPIVFAVSNNDTTAATGLGNGVPGPYLLKNVDRFTVSYVFSGLFGRTRDLTGVLGAGSTPVEVIAREPLSGTYNTMEFTVPRTHDVQGSQEDGIWPSLAGYNPLNVLVAGSSGLRYRAVGTGEMVKAIAGTAAPIVSHGSLPNRIGYFFWSYGNIKPLAGTGCASTVAAGPPFPLSASVTCTTNPLGHYLLLDGVDPMFSTPLDNPQGPLNPPTCTFSPSTDCPHILFPHLVDGSYGAWNIVRMIVDPTVTTIPSSTGIGKLYSTILTDTHFSDFLPYTALSVFRSHKAAGWGAQGVPANAYQPVNGTMCATPFPAFSSNFTGQDMASDVGGAILTINGDTDYAFDNQGGVTPAPAQCGQSGGANFGIVGQVQ